jgi:hypothetical protein
MPVDYSVYHYNDYQIFNIRADLTHKVFLEDKNVLELITPKHLGQSILDLRFWIYSTLKCGA